ncbi:zinc finger protein 436-like isoform X2 [Ceratina calcarata]|uniref:Zinc finger protein 436-like isoform X2 n=1 Tax=Ceratina calcarata TaxID=156304 RepID=A0AAJ7WF86_9HYME|nr:zinc finger protein 436-like isoform X2 [Ceratina calcarata]
MSMCNVFCLVCDINLEASSSVNVFSTSFPRQGELLANFVSKVLHITISEPQNPYICSQCYNLFEMLEQAQKTVLSIRCEILKIHRATERRKSTNVALEEKKLNDADENSKVRTTLQTTPIEEMIQQQCIHDNTVASASQANPYTLNVHVDERSFVSLIDSRTSDSKNSMKSDPIFSENGLQTIDLKWKEADKNVTEVEENTENTAGKLSRYEVKQLRYSCPTCGKRWKTSAELKTHIKTHSTLRPYMCEKCGQAYKHKHALEIHVGMHNGINPFQCNFCNKCFTQKGALMRHLPMHTGEMPYQCELCGKRFVHHTSYNMHRLSHSGKKSYKCHVCDLSLFSTSHLKRHMRVHTGERPYSCTVCGKRFAERYNLLAHQKIHDPLEGKTKKAKETLYQCNHCNLVFDQKENLNDHMKHHSNLNKSDQQESEKFQDEEDRRLSKKISPEHNVLQEAWIQMNRAKVDLIDNQTRFVLLQNPLPEIDENSFAVTFSDQKVSLASTSYNTNLQVMIEPSDTSILTGNLPSIDKMH